MPLTDAEAKEAKPKGKAYKLTDEQGLYLLVTKAGKYWRLDYRFDGKRKTLALGVFPTVALDAARASREEARNLLTLVWTLPPNERKKGKRNRTTPRRRPPRCDSILPKAAPC